MNRRGFLGTILAAAVAPAIVRVENLMPVRSIEIATTEEVIAVATMRGNTLLTIEQITREALRIAHQQKLFIGTINRQFKESKMGDRLVIRLPELYR